MTALTGLLAAGCIGAAGHVVRAEGSGTPPGSQSDAVLAAPGPMDPSVPTPESILGHAVGDEAARYDALVRYLHALADASERVTLTPYGESHEGRALYYLTITSEANHARLQAIKADNAKLADPRTLSGSDEADRILDRLPGVAWLGYAIHGDELSSTDAAIQVAYQLTAGMDESTSKLRDELVIHIDPLANPDGRARYLAQMQQLTGKVPNSDYEAMQHSGLWSAGRGNHYLFDLNRDCLMQVHPETRGRLAAVRSWNPHLVVDSHEMKGLDTYLFDPPREPINVHLSEENMKWRRRFSANHAEAFNRHGWSYYTREWHEQWYPGYTGSWTSLLGSVSLLYEQARVDATSVKQRTGHELTYREAVQHHIVSTWTDVQTLHANRREILADFLADKQWAVSDRGPFTETYLLPPPPDRARFDRFVDLLHRHGLETSIAGESFEARNVADIWGRRMDSRPFPAGTLVIRSAQPQRRLLHATLAFDPHMPDEFLVEERKELANHRGTRIYDVTAWNLSMAYGFEAFWAETVPDVPAAADEPGQHDSAPLPHAPPRYGYIIDGADANVFPALVRLFDRDCKPRVATKPFAVAGRDYKPGAVVLRRHENPDTLSQILDGITADLSLDVRPLDTALSEEGPDLGGRRFRLLQPPRVAIASQWPVSSMSFGSVWLLLDERIGLRVSPINVQRLGAIDLRKYNVLILPDAARPAALAAVLDEKTVQKLKAWVEAGGTLIALGNSAAFVAGKDRGLSSVRLRRDALDQLGVYKEALGRERSARDVKVDPVAVWGPQPQTDATTQPAASEPDKTAHERDAKPDVEALQRTDEWERVFSPTGAILAASLDPEHWLCFGLGEKLPVLLAGDFAYLARHPVATPARLMDEQYMRLSGLLWPEARTRLADTAWATVERIGAGQIILFSTDPFFRAYFEGSGRLLLNAIVLGPGAGTSAPVPW